MKTEGLEFLESLRKRLNWTGKYCEEHKNVKIYKCTAEDCTGCDVKDICNNRLRCGECDINYLKAKTNGKINWWCKTGRQEAEEREKEKAK